MGKNTPTFPLAILLTLEPLTPVDSLLASRDSGLSAVQPTFLRANPGRLMLVGIRWKFGVE